MSKVAWICGTVMFCFFFMALAYVETPTEFEIILTTDDETRDIFRAMEEINSDNMNTEHLLKIKDLEHEIELLQLENSHIREVKNNE